jgi:hypothetical protein
MSAGRQRFKRAEIMRAIFATADAVAPRGLKVTGTEFDGRIVLRMEGVKCR